MMWPINKPAQPHDWLDFEPVTVLYEYDGPRIFTCKDVTDQLFLAYRCGRDRETIRFVVVPFSEDLERQLVTGDINLRDALTRPRTWVFDLNKQWQPIRCWRVNSGELPPRVLPRPGVMLYAHLTPVMNRDVVLPATAVTSSSWLPPLSEMIPVGAR